MLSKPDRITRSLRALAVAALSLAFVAALGAQEQNCKAAESKPAPEIYQTIYLANDTQRDDVIEVLSDLRNLLPSKTRIYAIPAQNAISLRGTAEDIQQAQMIVAELDRPRKSFRLTFTITEFDGSKRLGAQHQSFIQTLGQKSTLKQGSRVPLVTGKTDTDSPTPASIVQYQNVGLEIEASIEGSADSISLRSKIAQSSLADEKSGIGAQDPIIHENTLEGSVQLTPGKPLVLGSIDLPGTTHHQEIEVLAELIH